MKTEIFVEDVHSTFTPLIEVWACGLCRLTLLRVNQVAWDLEAFTCIRHLWKYLVMRSAAFWSFLIIARVILEVAKIAVLSAKCGSYTPRDWGMSQTKMLNKVGDQTAPWGTPAPTSNLLERGWPIFIRELRPSR